MIRYPNCRLLCPAILLVVTSLALAEETKTPVAQPPAAAQPSAAAPNDSAKPEAAVPQTDNGKGTKPKGDAEPAKSEKTATHTVKREPLKITIVLDGSFEAKTAHEIFVKPEEWNSLSVNSATPHGTHVGKGDVILSLDTEKIDRVIEDLRTDIKISEISIQQGDDQFKALDKLMPLDLEAGKRSARISEEDRKYFTDIERPFALKMADFRLKLAEQSLEYEEEELRQLEKMYKADEITEETEQIVLKRARDTVEKAKFIFEYVKNDRDQVVTFNIPRYGEIVEDSAQRKTIDWEKTKIELPLAVQKQRLELDKLRIMRDKNEEKLKKLLADRDMMTVKSPTSGIVYYGKCVRGKFSDSNSLAESLRPNGSIMPNQIVMTVVEPRPMFITAAVPESQLHYLRPGLKGIATSAGYPDLKLSAEIDDVSDVPAAPGSFDADLSVTLSRKAKWIMPGMSCKVKLIPYLKKDALVVPPKCVQTDKLDDEKNYVWMLGKDDKPERRDVEIGEKTDKQVEILKGLAEGDKVLLEAPKE